MICHRFVWVLVLALLSGTGNAQPTVSPSAHWLDADYSGLHVVVSPDTAPIVEEAIAAFSLYWAMCTTKRVTQNAINSGRINVWVDGERAVAEGLVEQEEWNALLPEQVIVRSFSPSIRQGRQGVGKHLLMIGRTPESTADAIYTCIDHVLRVRWITPGEVDTPRVAMNLNPFDHKEVPSFAYRGLDVNVTPDNALEREWRLGQRLSEFDVPWVSPRALLPTDGVFPLMQSTYTGTAETRSAADPATADDLVAEIAALYLADPAGLDGDARHKLERLSWHGLGSAAADNAVVVNLSGVDWFAFTAPEDEAPADVWMRLVNRVAAGLATAMPDVPVYVNTLALGACRAVPPNVMPAGNVLVTLTTLGCNQGRRLNDVESPENAAFIADLSAWFDTGARLHMIDYIGNMTQPQRILPNLLVMQANMRTFAEYGVSGVHLAAPLTDDPSYLALGAIQAFFGARLMWDADFIFDKALDDFMSRHYGPAGVPAAEVVRILCDAAAFSDAPATATGDIEWLAADTLAQAETALEKAFQTPVNGEQRHRLAVLHMPIRYAVARLAAVAKEPLPAVLQLGLDQYKQSLELYVLPGNAGRAAELAAPLLTEFSQEDSGTTQE